MIQFRGPDGDPSTCHNITSPGVVALVYEIVATPTDDLEVMVKLLEPTLCAVLPIAERRRRFAVAELARRNGGAR